jgi:TPR repeat protein
MAGAQNDLGQAYADGLGVTQDYGAAAEWYRKAAAQGQPIAEYNLGRCYENGRGVPKDLKAAADWYTKAATQGVEPAKQRLAALRQ